MSWIGDGVLNHTLKDGRDREEDAAQPSCTEAAFEQLFLQNYTRVVGLLFRLVGDRARAEELADDVFWKLYHRGSPVAQINNLQGWLYRTATHLGIDALRAATTRNRYERAAVLDVEEADAVDPLKEVLRAEKCHQVRMILSRLKPDKAQLLILRHDGFSYKELAQVLGVSERSVGTLLNRAEAEFERRYREMYGDKE